MFKFVIAAAFATALPAMAQPPSANATAADTEDKESQKPKSISGTDLGSGRVKDTESGAVQSGGVDGISGGDLGSGRVKGVSTMDLGSGRIKSGEQDGGTKSEASADSGTQDKKKPR